MCSPDTSQTVSMGSEENGIAISVNSVCAWERELVDFRGLAYHLWVLKEGLIRKAYGLEEDKDFRDVINIVFFKQAD